MTYKQFFVKPKKVKKRDGRIVDFDIFRIYTAIEKAMKAVGKYDKQILEKIVEFIVKIINEKYTENDVPHVEEIQDIIEFTLVKFDLYEVAKAYITYRKEREKMCLPRNLASRIDREKLKTYIYELFPEGPPNQVSTLYL